jgi:hypothetical protein
LPDDDDDGGTGRRRRRGGGGAAPVMRMVNSALSATEATAVASAEAVSLR